MSCTAKTHNLCRLIQNSYKSILLDFGDTDISEDSVTFYIYQEVSRIIINEINGEITDNKFYFPEFTLPKNDYRYEIIWNHNGNDILILTGKYKVTDKPNACGCGDDNETINISINNGDTVIEIVYSEVILGGGGSGGQGPKGDKGDKGDPFVYSDFTPDQLLGLKGPKGDTGNTGANGAKGDTGLSGQNTNVQQILKKAEQSTDYIITSNAFINNLGVYSTTSATNWKFASLKLKNAYNRVRISGIAARVGSPLFWNFAVLPTSTVNLGFGSFVANDVVEIDIPNGAAYLNINIKASTDADDSVFANLKFEYLSDVTTINGFSSDNITIIDDTLIQPLRRKPIISFIFDDGLTTDSNVITKFNTYGYKCGFAIITSTLAAGRIATYLGYQSNGYEILSHSVNHPYMNTTAVISESTLRSELNNSLQTLRGWGFNVTGFVTPMSTMAPEYIPIMNEYYNYGFTVFYGNPTVSLNGYHTFRNSLLRLKRLNIEGQDVVAMKNEILSAINNRGCLFVYAHDFPNSAKLTDAILTELLNYVKTFVDAGTALVLPPGEAIKRYYKPTHEDFYEAFL